MKPMTMNKTMIMGTLILMFADSNAKIQMENIAAGLIEVDPGNKDYYKANLEKYTKELDKLDD